MSTASSRIESELREAPGVVARQEKHLRGPLGELVSRLGKEPPGLVVTCARGSSAYAAGFAKHLFERYLGIPVAAAAPSITTVYHRPLSLSGQLFLAISQSGVSDDLVETTAAARASGALTVALLNATDSPLAAAADIVLPIAAGPERSVAATKSFVAMLAALVRLTAGWTGDHSLQLAMMRLPERLADAVRLDWSSLLDHLAAAASLIVIGRGPTLAIAREAALKLKEVANRHAEAFSGAEFLHGPISLVGPGYPILMLMPNDAAADGMRALAEDLRRKDAALFVAEPGTPSSGRLPALSPDQAECDAVCLALSFYAMIVRLARHLGIDPDRPRHLAKITRSR
jgi:glucosamine--fructose-6-phosphate aminotransferase (isomerizing)